MVLLLLILTIIITKKFPGTGPESDRSRVFIPPLFSPLPFLSPPPSPSSPPPPLQLPPLDEISGEVFLGLRLILHYFIITLLIHC